MRAGMSSGYVRFARLARLHAREIPADAVAAGEVVPGPAIGDELAYDDSVALARSHVGAEQAFAFHLGNSRGDFVMVPP
jgi:hypothetical protein